MNSLIVTPLTSKAMSSCIDNRSIPTFVQHNVFATFSAVQYHRYPLSGFATYTFTALFTRYHFFTLISSAIMATCYKPDGTVATGNFPCWNTTGSDEHAPCCVNSSYCYSNGWCVDAVHMTVFRAGCTDRIWQSDACVKHCTGSMRSALHSSIRHYPLSVLPHVDT